MVASAPMPEDHSAAVLSEILRDYSHDARGRLLALKLGLSLLERGTNQSESLAIIQDLQVEVKLLAQRLDKLHSAARTQNL